ncbi:hypothetical protein niasHT_034882 [Heterodera trifolii]|uniref:Uncharacterized protein n=1 Tax=Heterodera trifolii TaxID=157864 RepID=A0ABD2IAI3_9BILA
MCVKFRSMRANSEIELKFPSNNVPLRELQQYPAYNSDLMAQKMALYLFSNLMEPFCRTRLCLEEFLLLRAILICHSGAPNLSRPAQKLIQSEAERYSSILLHFLQLKYGVAGASRYAQWDICGRTFADGHLRTDICGRTLADGHLRTDTCGRTFADGHLRTIQKKI